MGPHDHLQSGQRPLWHGARQTDEHPARVPIQYALASVSPPATADQDSGQGRRHTHLGGRSAHTCPQAAGLVEAQGRGANTSGLH
eukprot:10063713-Alexandrium_andersonii.AAC.1